MILMERRDMLGLAVLLEKTYPIPGDFTCARAFLKIPFNTSSAFST